MARNLLRQAFAVRGLARWSAGHFSASPISPYTLGAVQLCRPFSSQQLSEDRIEMFMDPKVQQLLQKLTGKDYQRVFRKRRIGQKLREPRYTFMTEEQLQQSLHEADQRAEHLLQMPPVLRPRKPIEKTLAFDPQIQGIEKSTIIFTDITKDVSDRDRLIVARDPDGTLRYASWEEREKMNAIYFPHSGREFKKPRMFTEPDRLKEILNRASEEDNTYEFLLDMACIQFEPDDPVFISVCETIYRAVDQKQHWDFLKSTRHYGPLVFYLVRTRQMDAILMHSIRHDRVPSDCASLISLFHIMFPASKSKEVCQGLKTIEDKIQAYTELDAIKRTELELELNAYKELVKSREEMSLDLEKSHGLQQQQT